MAGRVGGRARRGVTGSLGRACGAPSANETGALYHDWAASHDAELGANGYAAPARCPESPARYAPVVEPMLDIECGNGLRGVALEARRFGATDRADPSPEMLARAEATGVYRSPRGSDPDDPFEAGACGISAAVGVVGIGAALASLVDRAWYALSPGRLLYLSLDDWALAALDFAGLIETPRSHVLFEEYGPHLPGIELMSRVYVPLK